MSENEFIEFLRALGIHNMVTKEAWEEIETKVRKNILSNREYNQLEYESGFKAGQKNENERIKKELFKRAGEAFIEFKEEEAKMLRIIAAKL